MILDKILTQSLNDTTVIAEVEYSINFSEQQNKFFFSLHYNESNSFLFVSGVEMCQFKSKYSTLSPYPLGWGHILKEFVCMNKAGLYGYVHYVSVDYGTIDIDDTLDTPKYLMKIQYIK